MVYTEEQKRATRTLSNKLRESVTTIDFSNNDILNIIRNRDPNKVRCHDMISIRMVEICDDSICKLLKFIAQSCLEIGKFLANGKKRMWFQFIKRVTSKYLKTTGQYPYFLLLGKFWRDYYMIKCFSFLQRIIWYQIINQVLNQVIKLKSIKLLGHFESCKTSCPKDHYSQYLNHL